MVRGVGEAVEWEAEWEVGWEVVEDREDMRGRGALTAVVEEEEGEGEGDTDWKAERV